jgi:hypothetical protein
MENCDCKKKLVQYENNFTIRNQDCANCFYKILEIRMSSDRRYLHLRRKIGESGNWATIVDSGTKYPESIIEEWICTVCSKVILTVKEQTKLFLLVVYSNNALKDTLQYLKEIEFIGG